MLLQIYIVLCLIWGVFFTGYMFRYWKKLAPDELRGDFLLIVSVFFVVTTVFAPYSIWKNLPYVIAEFQEERL